MYMLGCPARIYVHLYLDVEALMVSCLDGGVVVAATHFLIHNDLDEILSRDSMSSLNRFCSPLLLFYVPIPHYTNHSRVLHFSTFTWGSDI